MDIHGTLGIETGLCCLCNKILLSEIDPNGDLESMNICADCKLLFLEDNVTPTQQQRTLSPPQSLEIILSQQFPDMINLATHMHHQSVGSQQLTRVLSDTDTDSVFDESNDIFPYTAYSDEDSEASVVIDNDTDTDIDTDIDIDIDTDRLISSDGSLMDRARLRRSLATNGRNLSAEWLREVEAGIGIGERNGIDDGEIERGTAISFVESLERVVLDGDDVAGLVCVICKDGLCVGSVVNRLPCLHVYHPSCIMPWLNVHNTCPLCRYELPIDGHRRINRTNGLVGVRGDNGGGWWWWCMVAPLVSVVGIGVMWWFRRGGVQRDNTSEF